jgi:pimeloyl-ACP methyl ester carboxylesterase
VPLLQEVVPSFRLREIPGQGHLANFFAPELLASIVLEFVESETPEAVK